MRLLNRVTIIQVQTTRRRTVETRRDDQLEALLAQLRGCGRARCPGGDDVPTADVHGDLGDVDVLESDVVAVSAQWGAGLPVVEDVVGEVGLDGAGAFLRDWGDKDGVAVEELEVVGEGVLVLWVEVEEGLKEGFAGLALPVEGCVDVVEESVASFDCLSGGLCDGGPVVKFLWTEPDFIVVAVEGVERSQGCPACAQLFGCVTAEATHVCSDHGDLEHGREGKNLLDGCPVFVPLAQVVAQPNIVSNSESDKANSKLTSVQRALQHQRRCCG